MLMKPKLLNILLTLLLIFLLIVTIDCIAATKSNASVQSLIQKAQQEDLDAQYELGNKYLYGKGVTKNIQKAEIWLKKAADNNYGPACHSLGNLYADEMQDYDKGLYYLRKGTSLGDGGCYYALFLAYKYGKYGLTENEVNAGNMLLKAAEHKYDCFDIVATGYSYGYNGLPKNKNKAIYWGKKACDQDYAKYLKTGKMPTEGNGWPYMIKWLNELGCDYDPALHVDEFKRWMNEKPEARSSSNPSNTANNAATPKSSKVETYVYTKSGYGQSQNTGQWTDAIGSEECVVQFTDDGISVNGMYQPYVKTSGVWKVYGGTSMGFGGSNTTFYYYVDGNKNMKQVCESSFPYGFDTFVYPMSRNGDPTPMGNNVNNDGYVTSNGANNNTGTGSAAQPALKFKCAYCNGAGRIEKNDNAPASFGLSKANKKCNECGKIYDPTVFNHYHVQCGHCGGTGNAK